jgi:hypothetical protein
VTYDGHYKYCVDPAWTVIRALGGVRSVSKILNTSPETVSRWNRPAAQDGTGGYIPEKYWEAILAAAQKRDRRDVDQELLASGAMEVLDVVNRQKVKGTRFERQVADDLCDAGFDAVRVPLSGALKELPGDVEIRRSPTGRWLIQCKIGGRGPDMNGRQRVANMLDEAIIGYVIILEKQYVAMHQRVFEDLVRGKTLNTLHIPTVQIPGKTIIKQLHGHDALVFRKSGNRNWYVVIDGDKYKAQDDQ